MKQLRWVAYDKEFAPAQQDNRFKRWSARGVWTSDAGEMHSFERLKGKHDWKGKTTSDIGGQILF